jgi:hypothetical protein
LERVDAPENPFALALHAVDGARRLGVGDGGVARFVERRSYRLVSGFARRAVGEVPQRRFVARVESRQPPVREVPVDEEVVVEVLPSG